MLMVQPEHLIDFQPKFVYTAQRALDVVSLVKIEFLWPFVRLPTSAVQH